MFHDMIQYLLPEIVYFIEFCGILIILVGFVFCFYTYIRALFRKESYNLTIGLGRAFAIGLQVLMGAEILKTVIIPSLQEFILLFGIVAIRMGLSLLIHYEVKHDSPHSANH